LLTWVALGVALVGASGSLYLSLGMGLHACALCFYQRAFVLAALGALATGLAAGVGRGGGLSLLVSPIALGGLGVATFHVKLELDGTLECPAGVWGLGTAPQQSLAVFLALTLVLVVDFVRPSAAPNGSSLGALALAGGLGAAVAFGSLYANPPLSDSPSKPPDGPPKVCRRPYVGPQQ
jgi:disulfide bond formation protein DsbB